MALLFANNSSLANITALPSSVSGGGLNLIKTQTASASSSISFVNGVDGVVLDGTYKEYIFKFINIHPATDNVTFQFNLSTDNGSNYNVTKTTTAFDSAHSEADDDARLEYTASFDLAQSTSYQALNTSSGLGGDADESLSGSLHLFAPSSTSYVKHFIARMSFYGRLNYAFDTYIAGYANTVSACNAIDFKMSSGNIDDGIIKLYGVS